MTKDKKPLLVIFLTVFIDLVGFGIIIPLSPYLAREFGADALQVGLLMAIYSGMQFLWSPFWGQLSDKWGRRPIILLSLFGAGASHLIFAFGSSLWILFVARAFAGMFGANISTAMAYIADITPEKDRSKGMGLIGAAFGLGFILGPFLGGAFGEIGQSIGNAPPFGKNFAAVIAALICFANFGLATKVLKESLPDELKGKGKKKPPRFKRIFEYLKIPLMPSLMGLFFLGVLAMANMEAALFLFVKDEFNWSMSTASYGFAYVGLIMVFTQGYLIRKIMPKWGERKTLAIGLLLLGTGLAGIGASDNVPILAVFVTLLALGNGFMHPSATGSISLMAKNDEQGGVMGVNQSLSALARIIGPVIGGYFYQDLSHSSPFYLGGTLCAIALIIVILNYQKMPDAQKSA